MPKDHPATSWHPKIQALYDYWAAIRPRDRRLPGRQHFDPMAIPRLLPDIWLLDVAREPLRLRYRVIGTGIVEALGRELTGAWMDEVHANFGPEAATFPDYRWVVEERQPHWRRGRPMFASLLDKCTELERILLPLARDGETVDMILSLTVFYRANGIEIA